MSRPARTPGGVPETTATAGPLEELLGRERRAPGGGELAAPAPFVGVCVEGRQPERGGRALVRWTARGGAPPEERWLACLRQVAPREGERVMVTALSNADEAVVVGVLEGPEARPEASAPSHHSLVLGADDRLRVHAADGTPLVEICSAAGSPVLHLLSPGLALRVPGPLALDADRIELRAHQGPVVINASRDVEVNGERIRLNSPDEVPGGSTRPEP